MKTCPETGYVPHPDEAPCDVCTCYLSDHAKDGICGHCGRDCWSERNEANPPPLSDDMTAVLARMKVSTWQARWRRLHARPGIRIGFLEEARVALYSAHDRMHFEGRSTLRLEQGFGRALAWIDAEVEAAEDRLAEVVAR